MESTLQKPNRHQPGRWPWRPRQRRIGADAAFAKAMARAEFGRFYTDDACEREVARSLARARTRREGTPDANAAALAKEAREPRTRGAHTSKPAPQPRLSPRERRTERAEAMARIAAVAKRRVPKEDS